MFDLSEFPSVYPEWEVVNSFSGEVLCTSLDDTNLQAVYEGAKLAKIVVNCGVNGSFFFRPNGDYTLPGAPYQLRHRFPETTVWIAVLPGGNARWFSNENAASVCANSQGGFYVSHTRQIPETFRRGVPLTPVPPR